MYSVREGDDRHVGVPDAVGRVAVGVHPVDRVRRTEASIQQVEDPQLVERRIHERVSVERHERLDGPIAAHGRVTGGARRLNARPQPDTELGGDDLRLRRDVGSETLDGARRTRDAVGGVDRRRPPVQRSGGWQIRGWDEPRFIDAFRVRAARDDRRRERRRGADLEQVGDGSGRPDARGVRHAQRGTCAGRGAGQRSNRDRRVERNRRADGELVDGAEDAGDARRRTRARASSSPSPAGGYRASRPFVRRCPRRRRPWSAPWRRRPSRSRPRRCT